MYTAGTFYYYYIGFVSMPHVMAEGPLSRGEGQKSLYTPLLLLLTETNNNDHKTQGDLYSFLLDI